MFQIKVVLMLQKHKCLSSQEKMLVIMGGDYPHGTIDLTVDLSDSLKGQFISDTVDLINSYGKDNPTIFITGRCHYKGTIIKAPPKGLRYWVMFVGSNLKDGSSDIAGFAIQDYHGNRIAYGIGHITTGYANVSISND